MCGRYFLAKLAEELERLYGVTRWVDVDPRWNIAPMQDAPVLVPVDDGRLECASMRWGLVPGWAKEETIGNRMINARSETAHEKPAFREALQRRRCAIPADGFYEWQVRARTKRPYLITPREGAMAFAGLWEEWDRGDGVLRTFTILTTAANERLREYHERMPVMLRRDAIGRWMDASLDGREALGFALGEGAVGDLDVHRVSTLVNSPKNDVPEVMARVEEDVLEAGEQGELF
ncbi:MAG: SOS response-associated peptidase [Phycisphaerales bacterium JB043]